jgi:hypothetical protein
MDEHLEYIDSYNKNTQITILNSVASTKDTTLIGRISDVVQPEHGTDFVA